MHVRTLYLMRFELNTIFRVTYFVKKKKKWRIFCPFGLKRFSPFCRLSHLEDFPFKFLAEPRRMFIGFTSTRVFNDRMWFHSCKFSWNYRLSKKTKKRKQTKKYIHKRCRLYTIFFLFLIKVFTFFVNITTVRFFCAYNILYYNF